MQDYFIIKGQIHLIEHASNPIGSKLEEWNRQDQIARGTLRMHLPESVYYTVQSCMTTHTLWQTLLSTYEKIASATKIYLIRHLYNL